MAFLAREVDGQQWVDADPSGDCLDFPAAMVIDLLRKAGRSLSFWSVETLDGPDVERLAIAIFAQPQTKELRSLHLGFAARTEVEALGIDIRQSDGNTLDQEFISRHVDLQVKSVRQAIELAKTMAKHPQRSFPKLQIQALFADALASRHFDVAKVHPEVLKEIVKTGRVTVIPRTASCCGVDPGSLKGQPCCME
jgi:hypothetical protein